MPRTRVYEDNAARQRAYRKRKKAGRPASASPPANAEAVQTTTERAESAGQDALAQLFGRRKGTS